MYALKLSRCNFSQCIFRETDFTLCDVRAAIFDQCDFAGAHFERTNLEKADLTTSHHFLINPERNEIKKARFSKEGALGLLYKWDIEIV